MRVPGAYELPVAAKKIAEKGQFDAIIALGAVIRGGTPHFDFVAGECNKGLAQVSLEFGIPVSFGVITTDSIEQAIERSGTKVLRQLLLSLLLLLLLLVPLMCLHFAVADDNDAGANPRLF